MSTNTKLIAGFIAVAAIALLGWMLISGSTQPIQEQLPSPTQTPTSTAQPSIKEFSVVGTPFKFEPAEIRVKKGDKVKLTFKNEEGFHNLTIKDLNIATKDLKKGEEETIEFTADTSGSFQYNCSVPTHTEKGMVGNLVVE